MAIISKNIFSQIRKKYSNKKIVYCDGTFDLTHAGHVLFFEECKSKGDLLFVGVASDTNIKRYKGKTRPILNQNIRLKTVDSFKPVDYCFLSKLPNYKNPLSQLKLHFRKLKPDIYVINEDAFNVEYRKKIAEKHNVKLVIAKRTCPLDFEAISTTKIIDKIKKLP